MCIYITREQKEVLCSIASAIKTLKFKNNTEKEIKSLRDNMDYDISLLNELNVSNKVRAMIFSECQKRSSLDKYFSDILKENNIKVIN